MIELYISVLVLPNPWGFVTSLFSASRVVTVDLSINRCMDPHIKKELIENRVILYLIV